MNYYKLINGKNIVGIGLSLDFRKFQKKHGVILFCDEQFAQYIQYKDTLYHDDWMLPVTTDLYEYESAKVIEIDEDEYNTLKTSLEIEDEILIEPETPTEQEPEYVDPDTEITVEYVKGVKIAEMNNTCNQTITNGFDVMLSDGETYHFSLTTQDQLNLITLSSMVASGETQIPYHADGELCKFYSAEDINTIITMATQFKTFQVSYFNALKAYIETMDDIETISSVTYGIVIPVEHQSEVLKVLIAQMYGVGEE